MLGGLAQAAWGTVINNRVALCTSLVRNKLGNCSCPLLSHFLDKPKFSLAISKPPRLQGLQVAQKTNTPGLQMMPKVKSVVPLLPPVTF